MLVSSMNFKEIQVEANIEYEILCNSSLLIISSILICML
jgi:hypothetical protein